MLDLTLAAIRKVYINNKAQAVICLNPNLCYAGYYPDIARRLGGFEKRIVDDAPHTEILGDDVNWDASTKLLTENGIDAEGNVVLTEEDEVPPCMECISQEINRLVDSSKLIMIGRMKQHGNL